MSKQVIRGIIPKYPEHSRNSIFKHVKMSPTGPISVMSQLNREMFDLEIIDENNYGGKVDLEKFPDHNRLQLIKKADSVLLYGGMSNSILRLFSLAKQYKKQGILTIAGGSHVDALPKEALNSGIDIVVHGEGEEIIKEILEKKKNLEEIVGISFLDKNKNYVFTGKRSPLTNLDILNDPDLSLVKFLEKKWSTIPISRGRGCKFTCEFCIVHDQYGKPKSMSNEKTLNQIIKYSDSGFKSFFFTDDHFFTNKEKTLELCKMIGDYKREFKNKVKKLTIQIRSEVGEDKEMVDALRYAGVTHVCIGYESPIDEELKSMKKGVTREKSIKGSKELSKYFYIHGMCIFGYPTFKDSKYKSELSLIEKANEYKRFFKKAKIDTIQIFNAIPLPGSKLTKKLEEEGRILPREKVDYDKYDGSFLCYIPEKGLDALELQNLPRILMRNRYIGNSVSKFLRKSLNYGNWANFTFKGLLSPFKFGKDYVTELTHNLNDVDNSGFKLRKELFYDSLRRPWKEFKRSFRNLGINTFAGNIVEKWLSEYKKTGHKEVLEDLSKKA